MDNTAYFIGYSQLPHNLASMKSKGTLCIGIEVDLDTSKIIDVGCTTVMRTTESFICKILAGYNMSEGPKEAIRIIEKRYQGKAQRAIITAFKNAYKCYQEFLVSSL